MIRSIIAAAALACSTVNAQTVEPLSEERAVQLGLARAPVTQLFESERDIARSEILREGRWPSPSLVYREENAGGSEETITVASDVDVSGRRGLRVAAARTRLRATMSEIEFQRRELAFEIRSRFYDALAGGMRVEALSRWNERLARMVEVVRRLQSGGEVSGYDRRRIEREQITAASRLAAARGALAADQERLSALAGREAPMQIRGTLLPPTDADVSVARLEERGDIAALERRAEAARLELRAAQRWWFPVLSLEGGTKSIPGDDGSVIGVAAGFPVFSRDRDAALRARAEAQVAGSRRELLLARAAAELRGLARQAEQLRAAALRLQAEAVPSSEQLVRTAEAAYQAGEVGILELLDAYESALEADLESIELSLRGRQAQLELQLVSGGTTP